LGDGRRAGVRCAVDVSGGGTFGEGSAASYAKRSRACALATLPANSHNTQPWIFTAGTDAIIIAPDFTRRCPAVDPDDHHLFVSLGCAAENLVVAASALGLGATPRFDNERIVIHIEPGGERRPDIVMRFGAGPDLPRSLRRPPEQVMHP